LVIVDLDGELGVGEETPIVVGDKGTSWGGPAMYAGRQKNGGQVRNIEYVRVGNVMPSYLHAHGTASEDRDGLVFVSESDH
jgi:hypothetical protein